MMWYLEGSETQSMLITTDNYVMLSHDRNIMIKVMLLQTAMDQLALLKVCTVP